MPAAANLLRRAVVLLPERDPSRLELIPDLGEALLEVGEFPWAEVFLEEAIEARHEAQGLAPELAELLLLRLKAQAGSAERWSERLVEEARQMIDNRAPKQTMPCSRPSGVCLLGHTAHRRAMGLQPGPQSGLWITRGV